MYDRAVVFHGTTPAAGAGFSLTNPPMGENAGPDAATFRLVAATFRLVTEATAGNRFVAVVYADPDLDYCRNGAQVAVVASTNPARFSFAASRGQAEWNTNNDVYVPLEPVIFGPAHTLRIDVDGVKPLDQLSQIAFLYERVAATERD
jgi:hypothetical protein